MPQQRPLHLEPGCHQEIKRTPQHHHPHLELRSRREIRSTTPQHHHLHPEPRPRQETRSTTPRHRLRPPARIATSPVTRRRARRWPPRWLAAPRSPRARRRALLRGCRLSSSPVPAVDWSWGCRGWGGAAGKGGDGEHRGHPTGGVPLLRGWPPPGGGRLGPGSAQGTRCTLLCPSSALFPSFLLERCFICLPHSRAHVPGAVWGGWSPDTCGMLPAAAPPPGSRDHLLPASVGFSWEPPHGEHLPGGPVPSPAPRGARAAGEGGQKRDGEGWGCRSSVRGGEG